MSDSVRPHRRQPIRLHGPWDSPGKNTGVGCHFLLRCMKVKSESEVTQSCPTLSDPMDCSLPGSSVHGIFQARAMEWGAIAFSSEENGWTRIQLILINLPPCTPPHVYTKRKPLECLQSSLTSVVTAILCPSRSNWGPVSQSTFDRTEETPYISKASCFCFCFFFWTETEILFHFSFSKIKLWVFEGVCSS